MEAITHAIDRAMNTAAANAEKRLKTFRFDIFKGMEDSEGKIQKLRSIGAAQLVEGGRTYTVYLKTLLKDVFYLMPEQKRITKGDYAILVREAAPIPPRRYFWHNVGEGHILTGTNAGLMRLEWDFFGSTDIYLSLHPIGRDDHDDVPGTDPA